MIRTCDECYNMRQPHTTTCPDCGKNTAVAQLIGPELVIKCSCCGFDVIGVSFFPACWDNDRYSLVIGKPEDSKKLVSLARTLNERVVELNQRFNDSNGQIEVTLNVRDYIERYKKINELGIPCFLDQNLIKKYSRILDCPYFTGG